MRNESPVALLAGLLSRRRALLLSGGVLAIAATGGFIARARRRPGGLPKSIDLARARAIGDGFYVVDGWVLTDNDLELLGAPAQARP